jgi:glutaredoxin 3
MKKITIFTLNYCPFCIKAKHLLDLKNIKYDEIDISKNKEKYEEMIIKSNGAKSVPQIFINDTHLGDCDYIHSLEDEGKLDAILKD